MQCIKTQVLENEWPFLDYGFNAALKLSKHGLKLGLNAANFFYSLFFLDFKNINSICILFINLLKSQY